MIRDMEDDDRMADQLQLLRNNECVNFHLHMKMLLITNWVTSVFFHTPTYRFH